MSYVSTSRSFPRSGLITGFVTRLTRRVSLVEQELPTLPGHLNSPPVFSGIRVTRSLVLYVCFVDRCLSFCAFSFGHCVVCSFSIYRFWSPLWYLLAIVLSDRLRYTDSDCPFDIFKLFVLVRAKIVVLSKDETFTWFLSRFGDTNALLVTWLDVHIAFYKSYLKQVYVSQCKSFFIMSFSRRKKTFQFQK
jgi:hypothetical protein